MTTKYVSLIVTERCNLNCIYCYEKNKSDAMMDISTIECILGREFDLFLSDSKYDLMEIQPFGGEPFANFPALKFIVDYIRNHPIEKTVRVFITTNGTLVHGHVQEWLLKNKDLVYCVVSLDGTREMHNINRSGSYDMIDFNFFLNNYSSQSVKMTVSPYTLSNLAKGIIHCHELGYNVDCNLAYGVDLSNKLFAPILERQLQILVDYYLDHPGIEPCSMLGKTITACRRDRVKSKKWCDAGTNVVCYDVCGHAYPCQFFLPMSIGRIRTSKLNVRFCEEFPTE